MLLKECKLPSALAINSVPPMTNIRAQQSDHVHSMAWLCQQVSLDKKMMACVLIRKKRNGPNGKVIILTGTGCTLTALQQGDTGAQKIQKSK